MALRQEGVEHHEQVQVDSAKIIHETNIARAKSEFPFSE